MAVPTWVERLRPASFESPSGVISEFKIDTVSRVGGKKASNHEILNEDFAIPQDQGNRAIAYPIEAYFTGENGDILADNFFITLRESYSIENPGILHHPRWGDIAVMPFEFQQSENLVSEGGVFRVTVDFRPIPLTNFPTPDAVNESEVVSDVNDLEVAIDEANIGLIAATAAAYENMASRIRSVVNIVKNTIGDVATRVQSIQDEFDQIQADIDAALSVGTDILQVMSQVNRLIRLPAQIQDSTLSKINSFGVMAQGISDSFQGYFTSTSNDQDKINNAIMYQAFTAIASGATAESAMFTDFETRDAVGVAIDGIANTETLANEGTIEIYQTVVDNSPSGIVSDQFAPDHDSASQLGILFARSIALLLVRSFDLKAKQIIFLSGPSDPITLTWKYYQERIQKGDFTFESALSFFILTNNLQDQEIIEIPSGKEVIAYG